MLRLDRLLLPFAALLIAGCPSQTSDSGAPNALSIREIKSPQGGFAASIAFHPSDPDVIFAGLDDSGGLVKSIDRGHSFSQVRLAGFKNRSAWDVVVAVTNPHIITLADAYGHGILRSEDDGATWEERNTGLTPFSPDSQVRALVADPAGPQRLFIGTGSGVFRSVDGGLNWKLASTGMPAKKVFRMALDATKPDHLLAALDGGEIYESTDRATSWTRRTNLSPSLNSGEVWDLVFSADGSRALAAMGETVMQSTDGGKTWSSIAVGLFAGLGGIPIGVTVAFSPSNPLVIYLGTFRLDGDNARKVSTDGGLTWNDITGGLSSEAVFRMRISPHDPNLLVAGLGGDGIEWSNDGGASWHRHQGSPRVALAPGALAQARSDPSRIYAQGSRSIARTNDGGATWERDVSPAHLVWTLEASPIDPDLVVSAPLFMTGILQSRDGGRSWRRTGPIPIFLVSTPLREESSASTFRERAKACGKRPPPRR